MLKARYTSFKQTTVSTQAAKTKRYHKQNHERPFTERVFTPLRVIFSENRESEDSHEKSIFLLIRQNIPFSELIQGKIA